MLVRLKEVFDFSKGTESNDVLLGKANKAVWLKYADLFGAVPAAQRHELDARLAKLYYQCYKRHCLMVKDSVDFDANENYQMAVGDLFGAETFSSRSADMRKRSQTLRAVADAYLHDIITFASDIVEDLHVVERLTQGMFRGGGGEWGVAADADVGNAHGSNKRNHLHAGNNGVLTQWNTLRAAAMESDETTRALPSEVVPGVGYAYVKHGFFFFVWATPAGAKLGKCEHRAVKFLSELQHSGFHTPLTYLVDYKGRSVVAQSLIPLRVHDGGTPLMEKRFPEVSATARSLVNAFNMVGFDVSTSEAVATAQKNGTHTTNNGGPHSDGGIGAYAADTVMFAAVRGPQSATLDSDSYIPSGVEAHIGTDGRLYFLGNVHWFPPWPAFRDERLLPGHRFAPLRADLLCFPKDNIVAPCCRALHEEAFVTDTTSHLHNCRQLIDATIHEVPRIASAVDEDEFAESVIVRFREQGYNWHLLGVLLMSLLRNVTPPEAAVYRVRTEMLIRGIKAFICSRMHAADVTSEYALQAHMGAASGSRAGDGGRSRDNGGQSRASRVSFSTGNASAAGTGIFGGGRSSTSRSKPKQRRSTQRSSFFGMSLNPFSGAGAGRRRGGGDETDSSSSDGGASDGGGGGAAGERRSLWGGTESSGILSSSSSHRGRRSGPGGFPHAQRASTSSAGSGGFSGRGFGEHTTALYAGDGIANISEFITVAKEVLLAFLNYPGAEIPRKPTVFQRGVPPPSDLFGQEVVPYIYQKFHLRPEDNVDFYKAIDMKQKMIVYNAVCRKLGFKVDTSGDFTLLVPIVYPPAVPSAEPPEYLRARIKAVRDSLFVDNSHRSAWQRAGPALVPLLRFDKSHSVRSLVDDAFENLETLHPENIGWQFLGVNGDMHHLRSVIGLRRDALTASVSTGERFALLRLVRRHLHIVSQSGLAKAKTGRVLEEVLGHADALLEAYGNNFSPQYRQCVAEVMRHRGDADPQAQLSGGYFMVQTLSRHCQQDSRIGKDCLQLGVSFFEHGFVADAIVHLRRAHRIFSDLFGADHAFTLRCEINFLTAELFLSDFTDLVVWQRLLELSKREQSPPDTLLMLHRLMAQHPDRLHFPAGPPTLPSALVSHNAAMPPLASIMRRPGASGFGGTPAATSRTSAVAVANLRVPSMWGGNASSNSNDAAAAASRTPSTSMGPLGGGQFTSESAPGSGLLSTDQSSIVPVLGERDIAAGISSGGDDPRSFGASAGAMRPSTSCGLLSVSSGETMTIPTTSRVSTASHFAHAGMASRDLIREYDKRMQNLQQPYMYTVHGAPGPGAQIATTTSGSGTARASMASLSMLSM